MLAKRKSSKNKKQNCRGVFVQKSEPFDNAKTDGKHKRHMLDVPVPEYFQKTVKHDLRISAKKSREMYGSLRSVKKRFEDIL